MTSRYFEKNELRTLFEKNITPQDIKEGHVIGVSEVCKCSLIIEEKKIEGVHEDVLRQNYQNILTEFEKGRLWILELAADNISRLLLDEDFFNAYCDKKTNPYELSERFSLFYDMNYSYWTENVYEEAFL
jgi:hypothetical protein